MPEAVGDTRVAEGQIAFQPQALPYVVQKAIFDTIAEITALDKDGRNEFAGFNYASIDKFYLKVIPIALSKGLRWDLTTVSIPKREGNIEWWTYAVCLHYVDDDAKVCHVFPDYARIVVKHPLRGPQDTGTTVSYADKVFARQFLKVPTREPEADEYDNRLPMSPHEVPMQDLPEDQSSRQGRARTDRVAVMVDAVRNARSAAELETVMKRGADLLREMEGGDLTSYRKIMVAVEEQRRAVAENLRDRVAGSHGAVGGQRETVTPRLNGTRVPERAADPVPAPLPPRRENGRRVLRPPE